MGSDLLIVLLSTAFFLEYISAVLVTEDGKKILTAAKFIKICESKMSTKEQVT